MSAPVPLVPASMGLCRAQAGDEIVRFAASWIAIAA